MTLAHCDVCAVRVCVCARTRFFFFVQGLVSNTVIDWFFPWPEEALHKVAEFFLADDPLVEDRHRPSILAHMVRARTQFD